jgi:hypothetical protein
MADTNQEQLLTELLGDVARADAHLSAPRLEARVMQAAALQPGRPSGPNAMYVVIAAAAVFVVLVPAAFWMNTHVPAPAATSIVTTTEQPIAPAAAPVAPKHPQPALARRAIPPSQRAAQEPVVQSAIAHSPVAPSPDEFVPLMPMSEQELSGPFQLVRVQMPRASLGALRLPLEHPNELVEADVLLGEDGMARAIRVSTSGSVNPWRLR